MFLGGIVCGFIVGVLMCAVCLLIEEGYFGWLWAVLRGHAAEWGEE